MLCGTGQCLLDADQVTNVRALAAGRGAGAERPGLRVGPDSVEVQKCEVGPPGTQRGGESGAEASGGSSYRDSASGKIVTGHAGWSIESVRVAGTWVVRKRIWSATTRSKAFPT